jgi:archaellum component FlaG (FlaF/FlaG flagellin family)
MSGIEPIIAVVILVAVTLVIAIGVIGWIMGWWGTMGATESLQLYPDSFAQQGTGDNSIVVLHIKNTGSASAVIYKVELIGVGTATSASASTVAGTISISGAEVTINPGAEGYITFTVGGKVTPGTNYQVKVYTRAGNVYTWTVQAKS